MGLTDALQGKTFDSMEPFIAALQQGLNSELSSVLSQLDELKKLHQSLEVLQLHEGSGGAPPPAPPPSPSPSPTPTPVPPPSMPAPVPPGSGTSQIFIRNFILS